MEFEDLYLEHHGVKGQNWGKRNGPPYPLDFRGKLQLKRQKKLNKIRDKQEDLQRKEEKIESKLNKTQGKIDSSNERRELRALRQEERVMKREEHAAEKAERNAEKEAKERENLEKKIERLRLENEYARQKNEAVAQKKRYNELTAKGDGALTKLMKGAGGKFVNDLSGKMTQNISDVFRSKYLPDPHDGKTKISVNLGGKVRYDEYVSDPLKYYRENIDTDRSFTRTANNSRVADSLLRNAYSDAKERQEAAAAINSMFAKNKKKKKR